MADVSSVRLYCPAASASIRRLFNSGAHALGVTECLNCCLGFGPTFYAIKEIFESFTRGGIGHRIEQIFVGIRCRRW